MQFVLVLVAVLGVAYGGLISAPAVVTTHAVAPVAVAHAAPLFHPGLVHSSHVVHTAPVVHAAPVAYSAPVAVAAAPVAVPAPVAYASGVKVTHTYQPVEQHGYKIVY